MDFWNWITNSGDNNVKKKEDSESKKRFDFFSKTADTKVIELNYKDFKPDKDEVNAKKFLKSITGMNGILGNNKKMVGNVYIIVDQKIYEIISKTKGGHIDPGAREEIQIMHKANKEVKVCIVSFSELLGLKNLPENIKTQINTKLEEMKTKPKQGLVVIKTAPYIKWTELTKIDQKELQDDKTEYPPSYNVDCEINEISTENKLDAINNTYRIGYDFTNHMMLNENIELKGNKSYYEFQILENKKIYFVDITRELADTSGEFVQVGEIEYKITEENNSIKVEIKDTPIKVTFTPLSASPSTNTDTKMKTEERNNIDDESSVIEQNSKKEVTKSNSASLQQEDTSNPTTKPAFIPQQEKASNPETKPAWDSEPQKRYLKNLNEIKEYKKRGVDIGTELQMMYLLLHSDEDYELYFDRNLRNVDKTANYAVGIISKKGEFTVVKDTLNCIDTNLIDAVNKHNPKSKFHAIMGGFEKSEKTMILGNDYSVVGRNIKGKNSLQIKSSNVLMSNLFYSAISSIQAVIFPGVDKIYNISTTSPILCDFSGTMKALSVIDSFNDYETVKANGGITSESVSTCFNNFDNTFKQNYSGYTLKPEELLIIGKFIFKYRKYVYK